MSDTPRTDEIVNARGMGSYDFKREMIALARQLERELAEAHGDAEILAKYIGKSLVEDGEAWNERARALQRIQARALKSPAQGATSTAPQEAAANLANAYVPESDPAAKVSGSPAAAVPTKNSRSQLRRIAAQKGEPAPDFSKDTAPQVAGSASAGTMGDRLEQPAAAAPDDPVALYWEHARTEAGYPRDLNHDALRALARHYEAQGMRKAAEIALAEGQWSFEAALKARSENRDVTGNLLLGKRDTAATIQAKILSAAAELECVGEAYQRIDDETE